MGETSFRPLLDDREQESFAAGILDWVYAAGNPYFDWFFDGAENARSVLRTWITRPSSEVFAGRAVVLLDGTAPVGGFIGLGGEELRRCRRADTLATLRATPRDALEGLKRRVAASEELFAGVERDAFYLSKMGVAERSRGRGLGREVVAEFLRRGRAQGFRRFRLDVWEGNDPAIRLYHSFGFGVDAESTSTAAGMTYLAMTRADDPTETEDGGAPRPPDG